MASHAFICTGCIFKGQILGHQLHEGVVLPNDNLFIEGCYMGPFDSLQGRCGFCSERIQPEAGTGKVFVYPKKEHQNILMSIHYYCEYHEPECQCGGCLLRARQQQDDDEDWACEDDPDDEDM